MKLQESALALALGLIVFTFIARAAPEPTLVQPPHAVLVDAKLPVFQSTASHCDVSPFLVTVLSTRNPPSSWYDENYCGYCSTGNCGPGTPIHTVCGYLNLQTYTCQPQGPICSRDHGQMCDCLPTN